MLWDSMNLFFYCNPFQFLFSSIFFYIVFFIFCSCCRSCVSLLCCFLFVPINFSTKLVFAWWFLICGLSFFLCCCCCCCCLVFWRYLWIELQHYIFLMFCCLVLYVTFRFFVMHTWLGIILYCLPYYVFIVWVSVLLTTNKLSKDLLSLTLSSSVYWVLVLEVLVIVLCFFFFDFFCTIILL